MTDIRRSIADLRLATDQLKQAALGNDWTLAERIQKRRVALIEQIVTSDQALAEPELDELAAIRRLETEIANQTRSVQTATGEVLEQIRTGKRTKKRNRVQEAYGGRPRTP